jgi:3-phenylpropionate/cinnamic acid dioxygenase small subunit
MEITRDLWLDVQQFLIKEAWLLDDRRFEDWVELFTDDTFYFMPERMNRLPGDAAKELTKVGELALFEEDKQSLQMRVARLGTGMAWAEEPPSRTRHIVGNVLVEPVEGENEVRARSAFLLYRSRLEQDVDLFAGQRDDVLRRVEGEWKIARRTIVLDQAVLQAKNLSIFF